MITIDKTKTISDKELKEHRSALYRKIHPDTIFDLPFKEHIEERTKKELKVKEEAWNK